MNYFNEALKVLGLSTLKSRKQLQKAYRNKSKIYHPDNGGSKQDFVILAASYKYLDKKIPDRYQINFKVEDIINKKLFVVNDKVKVHATAKNLKNHKVQIKVDNKPMIITFNYMDKRKYPLTFEGDKCFVNIDVEVDQDDFIKGYTHLCFGGREYTLYIPNHGFLKNEISLVGTGVWIRFNFIVKRLCEKDGKTFHLTSEDMSQWYLKNNIMK